MRIASCIQQYSIVGTIGLLQMINQRSFNVTLVIRETGNVIIYRCQFSEKLSKLSFPYTSGSRVPSKFRLGPLRINICMLQSYRFMSEI